MLQRYKLIILIFLSFLLSYSYIYISANNSELASFKEIKNLIFQVESLQKVYSDIEKSYIINSQSSYQKIENLMKQLHKRALDLHENAFHNKHTKDYSSFLVALEKYSKSLLSNKKISDKMRAKNDKGILKDLEENRKEIKQRLSRIKKPQLSLKFFKLWEKEDRFVLSLNMQLIEEHSKNLESVTSFIKKHVLNKKDYFFLIKKIKFYESQFTVFHEGVLENELLSAENTLLYRRLPDKITRLKELLLKDQHSIMRSIVTQRKRMNIRLFLILLLNAVTLLVYLVFELKKSREFLNRFQELDQAVSVFAEKGVHRIALLEKKNDAIGSLASTFVNMANQIKEQIETIHLEKKHAEDIAEELKKAQKQVIHKEKLATLGEISAGVGHEINNPLAISFGTLEVLKIKLAKGEINSDFLQNKIKKIHHANERIKKIVDSLRLYARSDSAEKVSINLNDIVEKTLDLTSEVYKKEGCSFHVNELNKDIDVVCNISHLQQILINLISNAKDSMQGQSKSIITITIDKKDTKWAKIAISDQGKGISDEMKNMIFNPFFTTKGPKEGTGMGLSIVTQLIEKMSGRIEVDSKVGEGSTFTLLLPLSTKKVQIQNESTSSLTHDLLESIQGHILLVDDEKDLRDVIFDQLNSLGFSVDEASNGQEALELIKRTHYDFIISDIKMPQMNGIELLQTLRKTEDKDIYSVLMTGGVEGSAFNNDEKNLYKICDYFLKKPFNQDDLIKALNSSDQKSKKQRAA